MTHESLTTPARWPKLPRIIIHPRLAIVMQRTEIACDEIEMAREAARR
jgi:hypothetical protein